MSILESGKKIVEQVTGWQRPSRGDLDSLVRRRKANTFSFKDDRVIPNHPHWPLIVYRGAVKLTDVFDPAAVFEDLYQTNGWGKSWRNGIYDLLTIIQESTRFLASHADRARCGLVVGVVAS